MKARHPVPVSVTMRLVLPALLAAACAAESQPILDLVLIEGPALRPKGAAASALWDETVVAAQAWITDRVGAVPCPRRIALSLRAETGSDLTQWHALGLTCETLDAEAATRIADRLATWRAATATTDAGGFHATLGDHGPAPALPESRTPGLTVTLHLAEALESLRLAAAEEIPARIEVDEAIALLGRLQPRWGVGEGSRGWCETGLPARWFRPLASADLAGVADEATWCVALAVDGQALAADAADLPPTLGAAFALGSAALGLALDPPRAAAACDGTWIACGTGLDVLVAIPRHQTIDHLATVLLAKAKIPLPAEGGDPLRVEGGVFLQRTATRWLLASGPALLQRWQAGAPAPAGFADAAGTHGVYGRILPSGAALAAEIPDELAWGLPLAIQPRSVRAMLADLGTEATDPVADRLRTAWASGMGLRGTLTGEVWRWDLDGEVLPWFLPATSLWWALSAAVGEEGRLDLAATIADLRTQGRAVLPEDLLPTEPPAPVVPADLAAACRRIQDLAAGDRAQAAWEAFVERGHLPARVDPADVAPWEALLTESAWVDGLGDVDLSREFLRQEATAGRLGPQRRLPQNDAATALVQAGQALIAAGDVRGLVLLRRARPFHTRPLSVIEVLVGMRTRMRSDAAMVAAVAAGLVDDAAIRAWLAEPATVDRAAAMRAENALYVGAFAQDLLAGSMPEIDPGWRVAMPRLWSLPHATAFTASDLARFLRIHEDLIAGDRKRLGEACADMGSPFIAMILSPPAILDRQIDQAAFRHHLQRLAGRLLLAGCPADAAAAEAAVGPLVVPVGEVAVPFTYRREGDLFTLTLTTEKPADLDEALWRNLNHRRAVQTRLILDRLDQIQVGPIQRLAAMGGDTDDF